MVVENSQSPQVCNFSLESRNQVHFIRVEFHELAMSSLLLNANSAALGRRKLPWLGSTDEFVDVEGFLLEFNDGVSDGPTIQISYQQ